MCRWRAASRLLDEQLDEQPSRARREERGLRKPPKPSFPLETVQRPTMALATMIRNRDGGRSGRCHIHSGVAEGRSIAEVGKRRSRDRVGGGATLDLAPVADWDDDDASRHQVAGTDPRHTGDLAARVVDANGLALVDP